MGFNTPLPVPLRDECRKAAKIVRSFIDTSNNGLDKVVPRSVLEHAAGFAIFTVAKAGFLFSARAGSGLVIARLDDGSWSPPSAIGVGGFGFGGQVGAEVTDFLIVLNSRSAVASFMSSGSLTLGGNLSIAMGPLGRNAEGSGAVSSKGQVAAMYSYSKTKGLFGGVSLEGSIIVQREDANRIAYGGNPTAKQILSGTFDPPDWSHVLIEALDKATGLPGGQTWVRERGDKGAMGWTSPAKNNRTTSGYAFGEGVGAGGTTSSRRRSSSLFSIGGNDKNGATAASMFQSDRGHSSSDNMSTTANTTPIVPSERPAPQRPWERRASSYLPFSGSMNFGSKGGRSAQRTAGPSSESYNAEARVVPDNDVGSPTKGSIRRPYAAKPTPSPFATSDFGASPTGSRDVSPGPHSPAMESPDLLHEFGMAKQPSSPTTRARDSDLLGSWDADGRGLTTTFGRLNINTNISNGHSPRSTNGHSPRSGFGASFANGGRGSSLSTPTRSRANSVLPFDDIAEDPSAQSARLRESHSSFATRDWSLPMGVPVRGAGGARERRDRPFSSYAPPTGWKTTFASDDDELATPHGLDEDPYSIREAKSQPFDDYLPSPTKAVMPKTGDVDGYARAIALFNFAGTHDGDLALKKGQVIHVLEGVGEGAEWWKGRLQGTGAEGIFPANYVEVLDIPRKLRGGLTKTALRRRVLVGDDFD